MLRPVGEAFSFSSATPGRWLPNPPTLALSWCAGIWGNVVKAAGIEVQTF